MAEDALKNDRKLSSRAALADGNWPSPERDNLETSRLHSLILQPNQEWNAWTEGSTSAGNLVYRGTSLVSSWTESQQCSENHISSSIGDKVAQGHGSPTNRNQEFDSQDKKSTTENNTGLSLLPNRSVTEDYEGVGDDNVLTNHPSIVPDTVSGFSSRYAGQSGSELHAMSHSKQRTPTKTWDKLNPEDVSPVFLESRGLGDSAEKKLLEFHYISSLDNQRSVAVHSNPSTVAMDSFCTSGSSVKHCTPLPDYLLSSQFSRPGTYFHDDGLCTRAPLLVQSVIPGLPGMDPMYIHGNGMTGLASVCQQKYLLAIEKATPTDPEWEHGLRAPVWPHPSYAAPSTVSREPTGLQNALNKEKMDSATSMDCGPRLLADHHMTTTNIAALHVSSPVVTREKSYMSVNANTFPPAAAYPVLSQATHCTVMSEGNRKENRQLETLSPPNKQNSPWLTSPQIAYPQGHNHSSESRAPSNSSTSEPKPIQKEKTATASLAEQNVLFVASSAVPSASKLSCSVNVFLPDRRAHESKLAAVKNGVSSSVSVIQENVTVDCHVRNGSFSYSDSSHLPLCDSKHHNANQTFAHSSAEHVSSSSSFLGQQFIKNGDQPIEHCRAQPYLLRHHTKLKKAWMTRHSKQFSNCEDWMREQAVGHDVTGGCLEGSRGEKRKAENECNTEEEKLKKVAKECYEYTSEDEDNNLHLERLRPKPQHMEASRLTLRCEDSAIVARQKGIVEHSHVHNGMSDSLLLNSDIKTKKLQVSPEFMLQDTPCFIMPAYIQRCRKCWPVCIPEQPEGRLHKDVSCRFLHFRRLSLGRNGGLKAEGFATWPEAEDQHLHQWIPDEDQQEGLNVSESKYLLSTLGDQFCKMVDTERDALSWTEEDGSGTVMWKKTEDRNDVCDFCCAGFFNTHWMCSKCGFQVCLQCYSTKRKQRIEEKNHGLAEWLKCTRGQDHDVRSFIAAQFVPTSVVVDLWKWMHDIQAQFDIISRCACEEKCVKDKSAQAQILKVEETRVSPCQPVHPVSTEDTPKGKPPKEDVKHCSQEKQKMKQKPVDQAVNGQKPKVSEQCTTLCDLLASTALKLSLGSVDIGMAFSPVSPMLHSYERAATILDSIIARVVEKKIQEKLKVSSIVCTNTLEPKAVQSYLSRGGVLWLHDPLHKSNVRIFQASWRKHQPVLVSGSHQNMKRTIWRPQTLLQELRCQMIKTVNCTNQETVTELSSSEFWDGFLCTLKRSETSDGLESIMKAETDLAKLKPLWMEDLYCNLPLPEYSRTDGKFNLVSYLPENTIQSQLLPKLWAAYSTKSKNYKIGTNHLTTDPVDSFSMLIHTEGTPGDCCSILKDVMLTVEEDSIDDAMKKRLQDPKNQPGAVWHIYSRNDKDKIQKLTLKVLEERRKDVANGLNSNTGSSLYFDQTLRRRLYHEYGVRCHTVIQCVGDTVFLPAGSLYQVQCFASCISVSQGFLSPEHASSFLGQMYKMNNEESAYGKHVLHQLQMERLIYQAVKNAVGTLKRQRKEAHN